MYKYDSEVARITGMSKCPDCPIAVEPDQKYCGGCGKRLQSKFKIGIYLLRKGYFSQMWELLKE